MVTCADSAMIMRRVARRGCPIARRSAISRCRCRTVKEAEAARLRFDSLISQGNEIAAGREDLQTELDGQEDIRRRRAKLQASVEAHEKALALLVSQRESAEFRLAQAS